jgi:hypothetical protein
MTDQWDRFAASAYRHLDALGFDGNVEIYQPTENYDNDGDGYEITYPDTPTEVVSGETQPPSSDSDTDEGGTTRDADLMVYVRDDIETDVIDAGQSGEALTRVEVAGTPFVYEVVLVDNQFDGLEKLTCKEVDT